MAAMRLQKERQFFILISIMHYTIVTMIFVATRGEKCNKNPNDNLYQ